MNRVFSWQGGSWQGELAVYKKQLAVGLVACNEISWQRGSVGPGAKRKILLVGN